MLFSKSAKRVSFALGLFLCSASTLPFSIVAQAQIAPEAAANSDSQKLNLAANSPYRDPDIIYLEADELLNDEEHGVLTASGEVEGRYQDKTLRADKVVYTLSTGQVIATGNVVLIDSSGSSQYAEKLELSDELEAGTAADFTSRFANGGVMGAAFATRRTDEGVELYNAYYTACIPCQGKKPTWQIKARRVSQDKENKVVRYRDAVFQFKGIPFFYTPYLSHPDPTAGRASGWLNPFVGLSKSKGLNAKTPYYVALDPYSELTLTPHVYQNVNPMLEYEYRRKFYSGELNIAGSLTHGSFFNRDGDPFSATDIFSDPTQAPLGKRLRSHMFADGNFRISENWDWGFTAQGASDDLYLNRYDLDEAATKTGLHEGDSRRLISQIFAVGQDDDFRFTASAYGFQSLRTTINEDDLVPNRYIISREDDSILPVVAPKIELTKYFNDPIFDGRLKTFGDVTSLSRKIGTDYTRATAGVDWSKTVILPGGLEAKPFGEVRHDYVKFDPEDAPKSDFNRTVGQLGVDIRWPFIKSGETVDIIVEPRTLITQNFGDGKIENFTTTDSNNRTVSLFQDSLDIELDQTLFWSANKSTGYDFWQKGLRADVGGSVTALWGNSRTSLFLGKSFASGYDDDFSLASGLAGDSSDLIGQFELDLGTRLKFSSLARYDEDSDKFRRIDTSFNYIGDRLSANLRYYKIDAATVAPVTALDIPEQEVSGGFKLKIIDGWSARYQATHDLDRDVTRNQEIALVFEDDCTRVEFIYNEQNFDNDIVRDTSGFGIRFSLLTLGDFSPD